jgi:hypothetical protein
LKIGCVFSLALFPQLYMMQRVRHSDAVLIVSDSPVNDYRPLNKCALRTLTDRRAHLTIPITSPDGTPADQCTIPPHDEWKKQAIKVVTQAYGGLRYADEVIDLVDKCLKDDSETRSPWLVDVLLGGFVRMLDELRWDKQVLRGDTLQRHRYRDNSEFLLNLALEAEIDMLIVGGRQFDAINQKLFRKCGVELRAQHWNPPRGLGKTDCFLDAVARFGVVKSRDLL